MVVGKSKARTTRTADAEAGKLVMHLPPDAGRGIRPFLDLSATGCRQRCCCQRRGFLSKAMVGPKTRADRGSVKKTTSENLWPRINLN